MARIISDDEAAKLAALFDKAGDMFTAFAARGDWDWWTKEGAARFALARALSDAHSVITALKTRNREPAQ